MRALFRPFALHAAYTPIETIVFFCIIGTLAYFHILSAIKHSAFIDPSLSVYAPPTLRPAYALWRLGEWVGVREGTWTHAAKALHRSDELVLELQQVVITLDGAARRHAEDYSNANAQSLSLTQAPLAASVVNMTQHLAQTFQTPAGRTYAALCHRLPAADGEGAPCFTLQQPGSRALVQTLAFRPGMRDEFVAALVGDEHQYQHQHQHYNQHQQHPRVFTDEHGVRFEVDAGRATTESVPINQMRNGKWVAYAARALVVRFWDLAKKADSLDILLILAGYILMHTTFYLLLIRSRALGSSFWLPLAILSSAVLAMLISLPIAMALRIRIDPVALTEALPFLVCTVGFDKPLRLARAVFLHPHLSVPPALVKGVVKTDAGYPILASSSNSNSNNATNANTSSFAPPPTSSASASAGASMTLKPAPLIITESLHLVYAPIIRDYILEIAVLAVGAYSRVGGLSEVCALAALMLGVDCLLLCTYLAAILGVMVEVRRIKNVRLMTQSHTRSRANSFTSSTSTSINADAHSSTTPNSQGSTTPRSASASASTFASSNTITNTRSAMVRPAPPPLPLSMKERVKRAVLGVKGSGLHEWEYGLGLGKGAKKVDKSLTLAMGKGKGKEVAGQENPVARLKLLLIASFLTLHILNLITPLTPSRHNSGSDLQHQQVVVRKVDITAPGVRTALNALVEASAEELGFDLNLNLEHNVDVDVDHSGDNDNATQTRTPKDLLVKVSPPVYVRIVLPTSMGGAGKATRRTFASSVSSSAVPSLDSSLHTTYHAHAHQSQSTGSTPVNGFGGVRRTTSEVIESFMSSWTRLVGDPILSKWIVIILAISVALNGYLLKGIAAGVVGTRIGAGVLGLKGEVRFEGVGLARGDEEEEEEEEHEVEAEEEKVKEEVKPVQHTHTLRRESSALTLAAKSVGTFSLEDVDRRLEHERKYTAVSPAVTKDGRNKRRMTVTARPLSGSSAVSTSVIGQPTPPYSESSASDTSSALGNENDNDANGVQAIRTLEECIDVFENGPRPISESLALLNDEEIILLAQNGKIAAYALEKVLGMNELERAVRIRRALISRASLTQTLESSDIPLANYDYSRVLGACCENVVGYIPLPLGIAGPLNVDGTLYPIPMATAEGTLVASTSRGCKALNAGGGVTTVLVKDGMTRGPAIDFPTIKMAAHAKLWIDSEDGYAVLKEAFESTSRFARLKSLKTAMAGRTLFVRFATGTGDAMGMNMISKGTEKALEVMQRYYPEMVVLALSGNYCTDKKPAAINWIEGRGKSVVAEAVVPGKIVTSVLKTTVDSLVNLNTKKNLVGSAMAGSIGGFNAHAANILTAIFLATGQDPAQNVESSMCMTLMESINDGKDLLMTVSMPCIEVGTVGGGTVLGPQQSVLEMLGMKGAHPSHPGQNAQALARLIAAAVMAGELSLLSALAAGHLIRAHMAHNRSQTNTPAVSMPSTPAIERSGSPVLRAQLPSTPAPPYGKEEEKEEAKSVQIQMPMSPSSSTKSIPPYSQ